MFFAGDGSAFADAVGRFRLSKGVKMRGTIIVAILTALLLALPALAHRVVLRTEQWVRGVPAEDVIGAVLGEVPAPAWPP